MKRTKRLLAGVSALLLFGMYLCTLIFALIGSPDAIRLLKASIACTILLPVLLYAYILVYRILRGKGADEQDSEDTPDSK